MRLAAPALVRADYRPGHIASGFGNLSARRRNRTNYHRRRPRYAGAHGFRVSAAYCGLFRAQEFFGKIRLFPEIQNECVLPAQGCRKRHDNRLPEPGKRAVPQIADRKLRRLQRKLFRTDTDIRCCRCARMQHFGLCRLFWDPDAAEPAVHFIPGRDNLGGLLPWP